jgi:hypothetical protein
MRVFEPKRDELAGEWRNIHNEEIHDLYFSPTIARVIKSRIMKLVGASSAYRWRRGVFRFLVGKSKGNSHLVDPVVDGRIILRRNLRKLAEWVWTGLC